MTTNIILVRHAESLKNIKDIQGGSGEPLTSFGRKQIISLANSFKALGVSNVNSVIISVPCVQTSETSNILSRNTGIPIEKMHSFIPLNLGVIHGLSNAEIKTLYPQMYDRLIRWRHRQIDISELNIPGMENPNDFFDRGKEILSNITPNKYNIFVATNSLYILLLNILLGPNGCFGDGGYKCYNVPNCGVVWFEQLGESRYFIKPENTGILNDADLPNFCSSGDVNFSIHRLCFA